MTLKYSDIKSFVPQHAERMIIVGFHEDIFGGLEVFRLTKMSEPRKVVKDIWDTPIEEKYTLTDQLLKYLNMPLQVRLSTTSPTQKRTHKTFRLCTSISHAIRTTV